MKPRTLQQQTSPLLNTGTPALHSVLCHPLWKIQKKCKSVSSKILWSSWTLRSVSRKQWGLSQNVDKNLNWNWLKQAVGQLIRDQRQDWFRLEVQRGKTLFKTQFFQSFPSANCKAASRWAVGWHLVAVRVRAPSSCPYSSLRKSRKFTSQRLSKSFLSLLMVPLSLISWLRLIGVHYWSWNTGQRPLKNRTARKRIDTRGFNWKGDKWMLGWPVTVFPMGYKQYVKMKWGKFCYL